MELSIQERLKDLRVERGLTLEQLEEQVNLSKSALGSYEAKDFKDISHYAIIKLAKFYGVTADYLLGLSQTKNHPNADLADLRLSDDMIELLKSGRVNNSLLCELRGGEAGAGRKRHSGYHERNHYEAAQSQLVRPAVKTAYRRPY